MIVLQTDNHIVAVGQCTKRKVVTAETVVFRLQTIQVYYISDLHSLSLSQSGQSPVSGYGFGAGLIKLRTPAADILGIESLYRFETFLPILHFYEPESSRTIRKLVNDDLGGIYYPIRFKQPPEFAFGGIQGQISDTNFDTHFLAP
jgi:hypothetical protein